MKNIIKTEEEWKKILTPEQYHIMRERGTEHPGSGEYNDFHGKGMFRCAACGAELFDADAKFDSGTGWPSFYQPAKPGAVEERDDNAYGMHRTEVVCPHCGSHLGHVFDDGPKPTGLRYCINSLALKLDQKKD